MARPATRQRVPSRLMTAEEFFELDIPDAKAELVRGRVVRMSLPKVWHAVIAMRIGARLLGFVEAHGLGYVCAETGCITARDPDTVRGPDVAFVSFERMAGQVAPDTFLQFAPDLAVEVISPSQRPKQIREKVQDWFAGGARRVWLFYPRTCNVYVLRSPTDVQILGPGDTLTGEDLLPGFSCPVAAFFEPPGR
ncbi:MAG TPA: Uma2 family endonuclease [Thermoanaerobaculia bacterium]|nr:Uma2 family endonuclease [Thermoanaerobaculia bacterium]